MPTQTTADSHEYHEIVLNTGRLDFEVRAAKEVYVMLHPEPKFEPNKLITFTVGGFDNNRNTIWRNFGVVGIEDNTFPVPARVLNETEYRRFWIKWDARNVWVSDTNDHPNPT